MSDLRSEFDSWTDREGIQLFPKQRNVAHALLAGVTFLGRGSGKTFVLKAVTRFLDEELPELGTRTGTSVAPETDDPQNTGSKPEADQ